MKQHNTTFALLVCLSAFAAAQQKDEPALQKGNPPGHYGPPPGTSFLQLVGGSNDCANAATNDTITGTGTFAVNTVGATTGVPQPVGFTTIKNDVWFYWTAPSTGTARLETCGGVTVDTKAAAWTANNGTNCPSGTQVAYNDDACGLQTRINWSVTAGQVFFLQLGAFTEGTTYSGTFTLNVLLPPTNDTCTAPDVLTGTGPFTFDTTLASTGTEGQTESLCGATTGIGRDVWYTWTAPASGPFAASTCGGTTLDTKIAVYPAGGCPVAGTALACNDDSCGTQSSAAFTATAGTQYVIQLGQDPTNTTVGGTGTFTIASTAPPTNDNCATPIAIGGPGVYPFDNRNATTGTQGQAEALCLNAGSTALYKDSWWTWTPTQTTTATFSTCGQVLGGTDTRIAIYDGIGCPVAAAIACNDDATTTNCPSQGLATIVSFPAVCGQSYTIQIGNFSAAASLYGTFTVTETAGTTCGPVATPFCFGDGTGTPCPCANSGAAGNGCASSINAAGGNLSSSGSASISADTFTLLGSGMPNSSALYFQGTTMLNGGAGSVFGDGLRCAGGSVIRLGTKANTAGASQYPAAGDPSISVRGLNAAGNFRTYQCWYRNAAAFCTVSTFNLTNGVSVTWAP